MHKTSTECRWPVPFLDVGRDAEVAGAQLAAHLLDLQLHCKGTVSVQPRGRIRTQLAQKTEKLVTQRGCFGGALVSKWNEIQIKVHQKPVLKL